MVCIWSFSCVCPLSVSQTLLLSLIFFFAVVFLYDTYNDLELVICITGMPSAQMLNFVMGTVYKQFIEKDISNFEDFHIAILDIFK